MISRPDSALIHRKVYKQTVFNFFIVTLEKPQPGISSGSQIGIIIYQMKINFATGLSKYIHSPGSMPSPPSPAVCDRFSPATDLHHMLYL